MPVGFDAGTAAPQVAQELMFGLMGVGLRIGFLLFLPLVLGFLLVILVVFGLGVLGRKFMMVIRGTRLLLVVVGIVLFLALCSLFKG